MALPSGVTTCTLSVGPFFDALGTAITATMTVTPKYGTGVDFITWTATGESMTSKAVTGTVQGDGSVQLVVPVVDQDGWTDPNAAAFTNWSYLVAWTAGDKSGSKYVLPVEGQTSIDVDKIGGGSAGSPTSATVPAVTSVNGQTGAVTVAAGGATLATVIAGTRLVCTWNSSTSKWAYNGTDLDARPSSRADIFFVLTGAPAATADPAWALAGDKREDV